MSPYPTNQISLESSSVEQTLDIGRAIGRALHGGEVIGLIGPMGSGKTHLAKGIALGLDVDPEEVNSPTFTLINEYHGRLALFHIDAYRLDNPGQLTALGLDELCGDGHVVLVEWADLVWNLLQDFDPIRVEFQHLTEATRVMTVQQAPAEWSTTILDISREQTKG